MNLHVQVSIDAPRSDVWRQITDIEHAAYFISGIEKVDILEKPRDGLVGLTWQETRTMFGKTATETMRITDAKDAESYDTEASSHGSLYHSRMAISEERGATRLSMHFDATPQTVGAKLMWALTGFMFRGATRKALQQDLEDIKFAVETRPPEHSA
jgi:carbon monoxide dehydrogenase subunit G